MISCLTKEEAKRWLLKFLGSSFIRGESINLKKGVAKVWVVGEGGVEKLVIISLPSGRAEYSEVDNRYQSSL